MTEEQAPPAAQRMEVRALRVEEMLVAAGVAARSLQDDPTNVAAYGDDLMLRLEQVHSLFGELFANRMTLPQYGAVVGGCVVAVAGVMAPGACVGSMMGPFAGDILSKAPAPVGDPLRAWVFWASWASHDLHEDHWHIGPVGVEPGYQGLGIGRQVMKALCDELDSQDAVGWLETNKERNVRFYDALGFEVVERTEDLGVPSWFMRRDPAR
ncbi:MAG: GNAT family N-acetyltransferase [Acidimicrobiales bacterium]